MRRFSGSRRPMSRCPTTSCSNAPPRRRPKESWRRRGASSTSSRPMATKVHMEALSPTMEEGRLVKWTKHEGDAVKTGDTLAEVETDKAVMELVARSDGQLLQQAVAEGTTVPVGNLVGFIGAPGEKVDGAGAPAAAAAPKPAVAAAAPVPAPASVPAATAAVTAVVADATRVKASPLARKIAKESGVDLKLVTGSGPGGRVIRRDLDRVPTTAKVVVAGSMPLPT